jgi:hypothetical protein
MTFYRIYYLRYVMSRNKNVIVGNIFLAFGLWSNSVYGLEDMDFVDTSGLSQSEEEEEEVSPRSREEELWDAVQDAGQVRSNLEEDLSGIARLIRLGADVTSKDEEGKTLLYVADCLDVLILLLDYSGIDVNSRDNGWNTVLHHLAQIGRKSDDGCEAEIEMLLDCDANPCLKNYEGKVARQLLEEWKKEEEKLPAEERPSDFAKKQKKCAKVIQMLREAEEEWTEAENGLEAIYGE